MYLATVIDAYSCQIAGWSMGENMQTQRVLDTMGLAASRGFIRPCSLFRSYQGVQFRSIRYGQALAKSKVVTSVGSKRDSPTTHQFDVH